MLYLKLNRNSYTLFPYLKYLTFSNESPIFFRSSGEKKNTPPTQPQTGESRRPSTRRPQVQVQGFWRWFQRWSGGGRAHRCEFHRRILTLTMDVYVFWFKKNMGLFRTATWWCENFMIHRGYVVYPCLSMIFNMKTMISCWDHLGSHINKDPHKFPDEQDVDVDLDLLQRYQRCPC